VTPPDNSSRTTVARPGGAKPAGRTPANPGSGARGSKPAAAATGTRRRVVKPKPKPAPPPPPRKERREARQSTVGRAVRRGRQLWRDGGRLRPPGYYALLATIVVLNLVGVVMVLSSSAVEALANYGSSWLFFKRQLAWTTLGFLGLIVTSRIDYRLLRRYVGPLLVISAGLLLLVLVPGVGINVNGSTRWLGIGSARFQPSEFAKLGLLLYCADLLARRVASVGDWRAVLRPVGLMFCFFGGLVMLQPDMGTTITMAIATGSILFVGGIRGRHMAVVLGSSFVVGSFLAVVEPYRRARLMSFIDPFEHYKEGGYQVAQSLIALGSGGWTGVGLGAGRAKWLFLPNAHTDFIFAIIGEELGLVGCALVLVLFGALAVLGIRTTLRAPDRFGSLLAAGITGWVVGQAIINVGAVTGALPVTGVPLPFVSFGGSALLFTMCATGVLLNVARQGR
jgi:cell division protein FtsW